MKLFNEILNMIILSILVAAAGLIIYDHICVVNFLGWHSIIIK